MGRHVLQPRLIAYMADNPNLVYTYSGATLKPILWTETVLQIKVRQSLPCAKDIANANRLP